MRWSRYYLETARESPTDAEVTSHRLMARAGLLKKHAAGIYTLKPCGWRSLRKLMAIVRRELDRDGALELSMPAVQPAELWQESGRWQAYGKELLRITDRHERDFCFGPTHEEVVTDMVRQDIKSYRQLPLTVYQIQTKFRDEIRPRFGLMRGREFLMKDAYSFHTDQESLDDVYQQMHQAYSRILEACGLDFVVVEADTGAIGGKSSHEFMVLADTGESEVVRCDKEGCGYGANVEKAETSLDAPEPVAREDRWREVPTPDVTTVDEVAKNLGIAPAQVVKTLLYETGAGTDSELVAVVIRGDREVNETKLGNALGGAELALASEAKVRAATGSPVGFAGPVGLPEGTRLLADLSVREMSGFAVGANRADHHLVGVEWGRDAQPEQFLDLLLVGDGDQCPQCSGRLQSSRGIEVGHIFKLGDKYSEAMGCTFTDAEGAERPMLMGCYGLGIGRTVAAAIEQNHDDDGIIWPLPLAPFQVLVIALNSQDSEVVEVAQRVNDQLEEKGVEVLFDDRPGRPGVKFKDADLVGIPIRVVVGKKGLAENQVEISSRRERERELVGVEQACERVLALLG